MSDYCEKCKRCHDDGLRNDEECCYYGEPNGCNHPNHGYGVIVDKYEALQKENAELRECIKNFLGWWDREDNSTPPHNMENPQKYVDAMRSLLEGCNHIQMRKEINE